MRGSKFLLVLMAIITGILNPWMIGAALMYAFAKRRLSKFEKYLKKDKKLEDDTGVMMISQYDWDNNFIKCFGEITWEKFTDISREKQRQDEINRLKKMWNGK